MSKTTDFIAQMKLGTDFGAKWHGGQKNTKKNCYCLVPEGTLANGGAQGFNDAMGLLKSGLAYSIPHDGSKRSRLRAFRLFPFCTTVFLPRPL